MRNFFFSTESIHLNESYVNIGIANFYDKNYFKKLNVVSVYPNFFFCLTKKLIFIIFLYSFLISDYYMNTPYVIQTFLAYISSIFLFIYTEYFTRKRST